MFQPPRCPHRHCPNHDPRDDRFYIRHGSYHPRCRPHPVPRFRCRACRRTFSRQTFRMDYRDHKPHLNAPLFVLLATGLGLRQSARNIGLTLRCTELKARKLSRHLRRSNLNLRGPLPSGSWFEFDEFETYETRRNTRPLSVPLLIEASSRFVVWAEAAPIRPRGKMTPARRAAIADDERLRGPRKDLSPRSIRRTLARGADLASDLPCVLLKTDMKTSYGPLAREAFGSRRLVHDVTSSEQVRDTWNPLFPINHTEAMLRDLTGRLRRDSWLVSKKRRFLDLSLQVFMAYRNYVRRRFNDDEQSAAQRLGFVPRRMTPTELLGWRQDWGTRSPHPLGRGRATVRQGPS